MNGFLPRHDRKLLLRELKATRDQRVADRVRAILLLDHGDGPSSIARAFHCDEKTVRNWGKRYQKGGVDRLIRDEHKGREPQLSPEQQKELGLLLEEELHSTTKEVVETVERRFHVRLSVSGMTHLLHRMGFSYKKPKSRPAKANPDAQRQFLKEHDRLKKTKKKIYFVDACHPTQEPKYRSGWIKKGSEYPIKSGPGRRRVNIVSAVNVDDQLIVSRTYDAVNGRTFCSFLRTLREKEPGGERIALILDNAAYHRCREAKLLAKRLAIELVFLPPYSPNLNVTERFWGYLNRTALANRYFETFADFKQAITVFLRSANQRWFDLTSLLTDKFQVMA